jgi:magnesium chelatase family protein
LQTKTDAESSETIRERVQYARDVQTTRFHGTTYSNNKEIKQKDIKNFCPLSDEAETLLKQATIQMQLSGRSYFRIIKLARTIADLDRQDVIQTAHIAEALQYRKKDS